MYAISVPEHSTQYSGFAMIGDIQENRRYCEGNRGMAYHSVSALGSSTGTLTGMFMSIGFIVASDVSDVIVI